MREPGWMWGTPIAAVSGMAWIMLACAACSSGEPPASAHSSGAEAAADKPAAGPATEPEPDLKAHMRRSFDAAIRARDAVIDGDLPGAIRAGDTLANTDYASVMPPDWMHWVGRIQERARELGIAPNLASAGQEVAHLALVCGDCHYEHRQGADRVRMPPRPWTDPSEQLEDRMLRHDVGAERMWYGLVFASEEAFRSGTRTLTRAPFTPPQHEGETVDPALAVRIDEIRTLAREARAATTYDERGRVYGELISRCASCHYLVRPAR
ncbi:MAG TPA: hypothetical protein VJR89_13775 [Polyangiales bacterium]|nr:hypothetical protein [Polyangiales bacterium]